MHRKTSKDMFWKQLLKNEKITMKYQKQLANLQGRTTSAKDLVKI